LRASIATAVRSSSNRPKGRDSLVRCQHRAVPGCPPPGVPRREGTLLELWHDGMQMRTGASRP
jgi:hypothetical protein